MWFDTAAVAGTKPEYRMRPAGVSKPRSSAPSLTLHTAAMKRSIETERLVLISYAARASVRRLSSCSRGCGCVLCRESHLRGGVRSEEHPSELQSLMRNSYPIFCFKTKK